MHRALLLPEIVSVILLVNQSSYSYLHTCLTINHLFYSETCRIVWQSVGSYPANEGHPTIAIKHLALLIRKDLARAQFYKNFIRAIMFSYDYDEHDNGLEKPLDEFRWHSELSKIAFPKLEQLSLIGWQDAISTQSRTEDAIIHYLGPYMRGLVLYKCGVLSDAFFKALEKCSSLRTLTLKPQMESTATREGLQSFMENANLTSLDLRHESFGNCWSCGAFLPLAKYLNLDCLSILDIDDSWVAALDACSKPRSNFPALKYLHTGLSTIALSELHKHVSNLTGITLLLENFTPFEIQNILLSASKFYDNEFLQVKFPRWAIVDGADLVELGRNSPNLQWILLGDEQNFHPSAQGIGDSVIEIFARSMPQLENLYMPLDARDTLTFRSLQSLGRYCQNLQRLAFSADVNWNEYVNGPKNTLFPKLWKLTLWNSRPPTLGEQVHEADQEAVGTWICRLEHKMPSLTHFDIDTGDMEDIAETDLDLMNAIKEMLERRIVNKLRGHE